MPRSVVVVASLAACLFASACPSAPRVAPPPDETIGPADPNGAAAPATETVLAWLTRCDALAFAGDVDGAAACDLGDPAQEASAAHAIGTHHPAFVRGFDQLAYTPIVTVASDTSVVQMLAVTGVANGTFAGAPVKGAKLGVVIMRAVDAAYERLNITCYVDEATLLTQLGIAPLRGRAALDAPSAPPIVRAGGASFEFDAIAGADVPAVKLAQRHHEALARGDVAAEMALHGDRFVLHDLATGEDVRGDAYRAAAERWHRMTRSLSSEAHAHVAAGEYVATIASLGSVGEVNAPDSPTWIVELHRLDGERITETWRLGAFPPFVAPARIVASEGQYPELDACAAAFPDMVQAPVLIDYASDADLMWQVTCIDMDEGCGGVLAQGFGPKAAFVYNFAGQGDAFGFGFMGGGEGPEPTKSTTLAVVPEHVDCFDKSSKTAPKGVAVDRLRAVAVSVVTTRVGPEGARKVDSGANVEVTFEAPREIVWSAYSYALYSEAGEPLRPPIAQHGRGTSGTIVLPLGATQSGWAAVRFVGLDDAPVTPKLKMKATKARARWSWVARP